MTRQDSSIQPLPRGRSYRVMLHTNVNGTKPGQSNDRDKTTDPTLSLSQLTSLVTECRVLSLVCHQNAYGHGKCL